MSQVFGFLGTQAQCTLGPNSTFACEDPHVPCQIPAGFSFPYLWNITQNYYSVCPDGAWLFKPEASAKITNSTLALGNEACKDIAGSRHTVYPAADIWNRLTTWKFPLFQLIAVSPRPPLGCWVEAFAIFHLLGDPLGTLMDLLRKLDSCQGRAVTWQKAITSTSRLPATPDGNLPAVGKDRLWKAFTIITDSYDEWGIYRGKSVYYHLNNML